MRDGMKVSERYYERHYTHCERCGCVISYSDARYEDDDEGELLCYDCLQTRLQYATIHDYSYTPRLIFYGESNNERFFGVELGYFSHRTTTCGLHVHISRTAFGETEQEQKLSIARLLYMVLDREDNLYFVCGDNPLAIFNFDGY